MDGKSVELFMQLAGQKVATAFKAPDESTRKLGAQLLLTELLEYIINGLGVTPIINGMSITKSEEVSFKAHGDVNLTECLDGLADVAYTMYWNAIVMGAPLEQGFQLVCENNLQKFVKLNGAQFKAGALTPAEWDCAQSVTWPTEVVSVTAIDVHGTLFAVGRDARGKVRKPSTYQSVDLSALVAQ